MSEKRGADWEAELERLRLEMWCRRVEQNSIDFAELGRRLDVDETEAEARYEQWLTEKNLRGVPLWAREMGHW